MIPPVPLALRLALSALCVLVSKAGFALAGWITAELGEMGTTKNRTPKP